MVGKQTRLASPTQSQLCLSCSVPSPQAEAIGWAWELLTGVYKLDSSRLYATYFGGDASQGLEPDEEARQIWFASV